MYYVKNMKDVRKFKGDDLLYCYGNGVIGKDFFNQCEQHGIKIDGYIISDGQSKDMKEKQMVTYLSDFMSFYSGQKLIVATDKKYQEEINQNLNKEGYPEENVAYICDLYSFITNVFHEDVEYRKKLSIFDYRALAKPLRFVTKRHSEINFYYGNERIIKKAINDTSTEDLQAEIEHSPRGIYNLILGYEVDKENKYGDTIYVSSSNRKEYLEKYLPNKKIISVGLFIKYADRIVSDEMFIAIKRKLGKVLLVFPYHSTEGFSCKFEPKLLLSEIKKHEREFDTVLICMYWYNITMQQEKIFKEKGYTIVTAGNIYDYYFLSRLRTIIELSDMTMSNAIGTHIAYCTCFNKPHYLVRESVCGELAEGEKVNDSIDYLKKIEHLSLIPANIERARMINERIYKTFGSFKEKISKEQEELVRMYYGEW